MRNSFIFFLLILLLYLLVFSSCRTPKESAKTEKTKKGIEVKSKGTEAKTNKEAENYLKSKYSEILGVPAKDIQNLKMYAFIDEWQGVPYKYGGRSKAGIDCSNFATLLYANALNKTISGSSASLFQMCTPVAKSGLREGDLLFFKIDKGKISHVGVYLHNNKFVHATTKKGVMINDLEEAYYKKYFYKGGRFKN